MEAHDLLLALVTVTILFVTFAPAEVDTVRAREELERIENLRLLHRYAVQELHDAKALAMYLRGWKGPNRTGEVETLLQEAEDLYGVLRGVDKGAQGLLSQVRALKNEPKPSESLEADLKPSAEQVDLLQRARRSVAAEVNAFYARSSALKEALAAQVKAAAAKKIKWQVVSQPQPWPEVGGAPDPREADRRAGLQRGVSIRGDRFFNQPRVETDYFLSKAAKAGITYANVLWAPACNWGDIEKEPGKYDFSALDDMIARFAKYGMRACPMLRTLTGTPPRWHAENYNQESMLTTTTVNWAYKDAQPVGINLFHEPTGEAFAKFLTAYAAHLKQKWGAQVDAIYAEGGHRSDQREIEAPITETQAMKTYWSKWSKADTPWRTPESILEGDKPDMAAVAKAEMCREAWLVDYLTQVRAALKQGWPELRVQTKTASDDFHRLFHGETGRSRDVYGLCQVTDNPSAATSSSASFQLLRSFSNGRWLWSHDLHSGQGATPGADHAQVPFQGVSRVATSCMGKLTRINYPLSWYRCRDEQLGDFGIGSYMLSPRRAQELAPAALNTGPAPAEVAVLWSQASRRHDASYKCFKSAMAWGHMLKRVSVNFDYLASRLTTPGITFDMQLEKYKVLILPNTQSMTQDICNEIRSWVGQGGIVLGFGAPGLYDEYGVRRESLPLADVFGADVVRMRVPAPITPDNLETTHPEGCFLKPAPHPYKFETDLTAALKTTTGSARAWFAGSAKEVAIAENSFGQGRAILCGFPVGFEYWETAPYEMGYGLTHFRATHYNYEQKRYEAWILAELEKLGITQEVTLTRGRFLRGQMGNDPDWQNVYRDNPEYSEFMFEEEKPVRTVLAFCRKREGIDNVYIGLTHTEGNYSTSRGYFRLTLTGAEIAASVAVAGNSPVVFDTRLEVPIPSKYKNGRVEFETWLPVAQSSAFAVAPDGNVRLFGAGKPTGIGPDQLAPIAAEYETGARFEGIEILDAERIVAFLNTLQGTAVVIGCGDTRFTPVARDLADWLKETRQIEARITTEGPRASTHKPYMDSFAGPHLHGDPVKAKILIGNCQDNGLMRLFIYHGDNAHWLPLESNKNFPGLDRAVVMLSSPVRTDHKGRPHRGKAEQRLVIGASFPSEALRAVRALEQKLQ